MRGLDGRPGELSSYVDLEERVPADHPLRLIRRIVNDALSSLDEEFARLYSYTGRPSIPPEMLLRALLLQAFYTIRSERQLMEQLDYNLLFRWFVGLGVDDAVWVPTVFSKNRDRLLEAEVAANFLRAVLKHCEIQPLLSDEHFPVDGTLIEAWASLKSFRPKDGSDGPSGEGRNGERDFHDEKRTNDTHVSTTDPDAMLFRKGKGKEARLILIGHALMENRHGLVVDAEMTRVSGHTERMAAIEMIAPHGDRPGRITLAGDKGYDTRDFVEDLRELNITPHVAQKAKHSAIDGRTTRHAGYGVSQCIRKRIEEAFGWAKTIATMRKTRHRGLDKVRWQFTLTMAAYNLVRLPKLIGADP